MLDNTIDLRVNPEASLEVLTDELKNFQDIAKYIHPKSGEIPNLRGMDIFGNTLPLNGIRSLANNIL